MLTDVAVKTYVLFICEGFGSPALPPQNHAEAEAFFAGIAFAHHLGQYWIERYEARPYVNLAQDEPLAIRVAPGSNLNGCRLLLVCYCCCCCVALTTSCHTTCTPWK